MSNKNTSENKDSQALSYIGLRKTVGIIAIALPIALITGKSIIDGLGLPISISAYYYTSMRNVMVGTLCAIAVFLLSYRGYERKDDIAGSFACLFAIGVALFPTAPQFGATENDNIISIIHFASAAAFFLILAYFSLVLFRKGSANPTPRKKLRNRVYAACGVIILLCILGIGITGRFLSADQMARWQPVFWFEAAAIWAFGWSWFTKGEGILKDKET